MAVADTVTVMAAVAMVAVETVTPVLMVAAEAAVKGHNLV